MPDPNDALLQQMAQAGLYPQQIAALKPLLGMGQQFMQPETAQGRQVGQTYVAASPLEHLSNAIRQATGAYMTGKALGKERDLAQKLGGTRQKYLQALQSAGQTTPYAAPQAPPDLLKSPDYDQQQAQAKSQFEAQQQAQAQQRLGPLLMGGAASGDPAMQGAAHFGLQEQQLARQQSVLENTLRHQQELEAQGRGRLGLGQERIDQMGARQKLMEDALALRGIKYDPNLSQFVDVRPMAGVKPPGKSVLPRSAGAGPAPAPSPVPSPGGGAPGAPAAAPGSAPIGKWQDKALKDLGNDFNPMGAGHELGKQAARLTAARRVMALAEDEKGNPRDLSPQQMPELAQSVASLIGGSSAAQAQIEHLMPKSYTKDVAGILQYLTNEPHGAGQQAFVKQFLETAHREQDVAQQGVNSTLKGLGTKHQRILKSNPNEARNVLGASGWDIGPDGMPTIKQQAAAPAAGPVAQGGPHKIASDADYEALPSGAEFIGPDGKHRRKP